MSINSSELDEESQLSELRNLPKLLKDRKTPPKVKFDKFNLLLSRFGALSRRNITRSLEEDKTFYFLKQILVKSLENIKFDKELSSYDFTFYVFYYLLSKNQFDILNKFIGQIKSNQKLARDIFNLAVSIETKEFLKLVETKESSLFFNSLIRYLFDSYIKDSAVKKSLIYDYLEKVGNELAEHLYLKSNPSEILTYGMREYFLLNTLEKTVNLSILTNKMLKETAQDLSTLEVLSSNSKELHRLYHLNSYLIKIISDIITHMDVKIIHNVETFNRVMLSLTSLAFNSRYFENQVLGIIYNSRFRNIVYDIKYQAKRSEVLSPLLFLSLQF